MRDMEATVLEVGLIAIVLGLVVLLLVYVLLWRKSEKEIQFYKNKYINLINDRSNN